MTFLFRGTAAVLTVLGALVLSGCAPAAESTSQAVTQSADPAVVTPDVEIAKTCAMLSIVITTANNAMSGETRGTLSAADAAAIINTIPDTLNAVTILSSGLASQVTALNSSIEQTPPLIDGAIFNPDAPPYRAAFTELQTACEENGTEIIGVPNYAGG